MRLRFEFSRSLRRDLVLRRLLSYRALQVNRKNKRKDGCMSRFFASSFHISLVFPLFEGSSFVVTFFRLCRTDPNFRETFIVEKDRQRYDLQSFFSLQTTKSLNFAFMHQKLSGS